MGRLPVSPRTLLIVAAIGGLVVLLEITPLSGWLSHAGLWAMMLIAPIAFVGIALVGVWSGFKYVRDRGWQD